MPTKEVSLNYKPNGEATRLYHQSPAKYRLMMGGAGAGKTTAACVEDIIQALEYPGSTGVVFRRHYPSLRDSTQRQYLAQIPPELASAGKYVKTEGREAFHWHNGSRTLFRCLDDFFKLGSMEFDRVVIDEAREVAENEFREVVFRRLRGQVGPRRLTCCTNPPDDTHWLYQFFVAEGADDPDRAVFHCSTYDNAKHLPDGYIRGLEKMTPQEQRQYLFGLWGVVADGPAVYPEFTEHLHVARLRPMLGHEVLRGWDFGFTAPACVFVQIDATANVSVLHEVIGKDQTLPTFATRVVQETDRYFPDCPVRDYCDIAGTQRNDRGPTAVKILRDQFRIQPHYRKQGVHQGMEAIRRLVKDLGANGVPRLRLNATCKTGIKAMAGGLYIDPKTDEVARVHPYIDWFDALRYVLTPTIAMAAATGSDYERSPLPKSWRVAV